MRKTGMLKLLAICSCALIGAVIFLSVLSHFNSENRKAQPPVTSTPTSAPAPFTPPSLNPTATTTPTPAPRDLGLTDSASNGGDQALEDLVRQYLIARYTGDKNTLSSLLPESDMPSDEVLERDARNVKAVTLQHIIYREGPDYAKCMGYAFFSISYTNCSFVLPCYTEFCTDHIKIYPNALNDTVYNELVVTRKDDLVQSYLINTLVQQYLVAYANNDEDILLSVVTDPSKINMNNIRKSTEYIQDVRFQRFFVFTVPESIEEVDRVAFIAEDIRFFDQIPWAPGLNEVLISIGSDGFPMIFTGTTSAELDAYRLELQRAPEVLALGEEVNQRLSKAIEEDVSFRNFIAPIVNARP